MNFFTELKEGLLIAWDAIRANKMRAALTTLGIIIGIVSVTLMGAAIDGLNRSFHESISTMGADVLFADRDELVYQQRGRMAQTVQKRRVVTLDQVKLVEKQMTLASAVAPVVQTTRSVRYNNRSTDSVTIYWHDRAVSDDRRFGGRPGPVSVRRRCRRRAAGVRHRQRRRHQSVRAGIAPGQEDHASAPLAGSGRRAGEAGKLSWGWAAWTTRSSFPCSSY